MVAHPSGDITEYIAFSSINTLLEEASAIAPPEPPSPIIIDKVGTGDIMLSIISLFFAVGKKDEISLIAGSMFGAKTLEKYGNETLDNIDVINVVDIPSIYTNHSQIIGYLCIKLQPIITDINPDLCIVYADRYESFAFAIASTHSNKIILPLGISFYTFQVIGFVVDVYRILYHLVEITVIISYKHGYFLCKDNLNFEYNFS